MTKSMITKVWIGGLAVFAAGMVVAIVGVFLMLGYGGTFAQIAGTNNYNFVPNMNGFFWVTVGLIVAGGLIGLVGSVIHAVPPGQRSHAGAATTASRAHYVKPFNATGADRKTRLSSTVDADLG